MQTQTTMSQEQEALARLDTVPVPKDVYLMWLAAVAQMPSYLGGELYVAMNQRLAAVLAERAAINR